jgi:hypothetical protein
MRPFIESSIADKSEFLANKCLGISRLYQGERIERIQSGEDQFNIIKYIDDEQKEITENYKLLADVIRERIRSLHVVD